jgi:hypothetical protein
MIPDAVSWHNGTCPCGNHTTPYCLNICDFPCTACEPDTPVVCGTCNAFFTSSSAIYSYRKDCCSGIVIVYSGGTCASTVRATLLQKETCYGDIGGIISYTTSHC